MSTEAKRNGRYGQVSDKHVNHHTGSARKGGTGTRANPVELALPKAPQGNCLPHWLLERRRGAEQARLSHGSCSSGVCAGQELVWSLLWA